MLRWFVNALCCLAFATAGAQDAPSYHLPGRLGAGTTQWTHRPVAGKWNRQSVGLVDVQYVSTTLLSGAVCVTNRIAGSWTLTDAGLSNLLNRGSGTRRATGRGEWTVVAQFEDSDEAGVLQRTRLTTALARSVQLSPTWGVRLALHAGRGARRWGSQGIWDSQYVANPVDPASAASGETAYTDSRSYFEGGFELGAVAPRAAVSYRWLHVPANQSLLAESSDPYTIRHSVLGTTHWAATDNVEAKGWAEIEVQGGARLLTIGAAGAWTFGEDSYFTGMRAATVVSGGLTYRTTGHLSPLLHVAWKRRWVVWVAPDIPLAAPDGRAAAGGLHLGLRAHIG